MGVEQSERPKVSHIWVREVRVAEGFTGWGAEQSERPKVSHNCDSSESGKRFHKIGGRTVRGVEKLARWGLNSRSAQRFHTTGVEQSERQKVLLNNLSGQRFHTMGAEQSECQKVSHNRGCAVGTPKGFTQQGLNSQSGKRFHRIEG